MSLERFRPVKGYENYEVSTWGRVFSKTEGRFLIPQVHDKGYLRVDLYKNNQRKHCKIHRLVAEAFIPNPDGKPHINHIDGNNQNNSITNLEWVTDEENREKAMILRRTQDEEDTDTV